MMIDPESHLHLHRLQQHERDRQLNHHREQGDAAVLTIFQLPRLRERLWRRGPTAPGKTRNVTTLVTAPATPPREPPDDPVIPNDLSVHRPENETAPTPC